MSLVMLGKTSDVKLTDFFSEIENKTGVKIESTRSSDDTTSHITSITFTDGVQITYSDGMELYDNDSRLVIVDDKNHLFVSTSNSKGASMSTMDINSNIRSSYDVFIADVEETTCNIIYVGSYINDVFNLPERAKNIQSSQSLKIVPAFCYIDSSISRYGFMKNMYINYTRKFSFGLKFIDQNGNEFITLGGYLLYYNGKHK